MESLLFISGSVSADIVIIIAIAAFVFGYIIKSGVLLKQRKRILRLEDEMLANHARILSLEKRAAEIKRTSGKSSGDLEIVPAVKKTSAAS